MDNYTIEIFYTYLWENTEYDQNFYFLCRFFSFDDSKRHFYRIVKTNYLTAPVGRLVLVKLMVASLSIRSLVILVFPVLHNRIEYSSWYEMRTCRSVYGEQNWTIYHR